MAARSPKNTESTQDRFWHFIWALAGLAATIYGSFGIAAQISQPDRHPLAIVWFLVAGIGGLSMVSFSWRAKKDEAD